MSDHTYRVTEIVGSSPDGVDQAIRNAVTRASETLRNLEWLPPRLMRPAAPATTPSSWWTCEGLSLSTQRPRRVRWERDRPPVLRT